MQNNNSKALLMSPSGYIKKLACEFANSRISLVMVPCFGPGFPGGSDSNKSTCSAEDLDSIPEL